ncbi:hypothetical protein [Phycisphaera mikurensis]|uniref:hypothetical protein n=1 Tax=Phycisphaera mikurensis TaxID=547188 RepID=UPI0009463FA0|nr:hypothetical protein [Phycisphaera mikurensis]MBB6441768.1 hypothetical protein [Phycisphaera mikurensis]
MLWGCVVMLSSLDSGGAASAAGLPDGPLVYIAAPPGAPPLDRALAEVARPMVWIPDHLVLDPHRGFRFGGNAWLRQRGMLDLPPGPLFYNKERGEAKDWREVLPALRRIGPDRRIGVFYTAAESLYREFAWSEPEGPDAEQVRHWLALRRGDDGLEGWCDFTSVYGYALTPDRDAHARAVLEQLRIAKSNFDKPVYLVTWAWLHPQAKQWGELAGRPVPDEAWAWEIAELWPAFEGVIVFAPEPLPVASADAIVEASRGWSAAWMNH